MKPYIVLLLYPDYLSSSHYGEETHYAHVEAEDANAAVYAARLDAAAQHASAGYEVEDLIADFALLLVIEGHHADLSAEAEQ